MNKEEKRHWEKRVGADRPYQGVPKETVFRAGTMKPHKGLIQKKNPITGESQEVAYFSWDADVPCSHEACPAYSVCPFDVKNQYPSNCSVITHYMKAVQSVVLGEMSHKMTTAQMYRFGMQMLPLYRTLARLKIVEMGVANVMVTAASGKMEVHPVYKEIRETIKLTEMLWRSIGLHEADFILPEVLSLFQKQNKDAFVDGKLKLGALPMVGTEQVRKTYYEIMEEELEGGGGAINRKYVNPSLRADGKPKLKLRTEEVGHA